MRKTTTRSRAFMLCLSGIVLAVGLAGGCGDGGNQPRRDGGSDGATGDARPDAREDGPAPDALTADAKEPVDRSPGDLTPDGPPADMTGDVPGGGDGGGGLGAICATQAQPGQPGSCQAPLVCCATTPAACMAEEDCPDGNGTIACQTSGDCPTGGRVCCEVPGMSRFCTQQNVCASFGGTVIP